MDTEYPDFSQIVTESACSMLNNPIKNFCWPLSGKEKEECIQSYEDVVEEEYREKGQDEAEAGLKGGSGR